MAFSTDWDIEKYKVDYESEEHWELRRSFLVTHKSKFPEDQLVCLAQVFYNVEFMGCRYPEKTMQLVAKLSKGVADEHREKMKSKLQRTFVQASDAASTKVKGCQGTKVAAQTSRVISFKKSSDPISLLLKNTPEVLINESPCNSNANIPGRYVLANQSQFQPNPENKRSLDSGKRSKKKRAKNNDNTKNVHDEVKPSVSQDPKLAFSKLVILKHSKSPINSKMAISTLVNSVNASKMNLNFKTDKLPSNQIQVTACINGVVVSEAVKSTAGEAKLCCAEEALQKFYSCCYTLIVKDRFASSIPVVEKDVQDNDSKLSKAENSSDAVIDVKAARMMKLMGWGGGGLGKDEQGRQEPVEAKMLVSRAGLGAKYADIGKSTASFELHIRDMLRDFLQKGTGEDLVFAADFSQSERAIIHRIANRFGLKSTSYGAHPNRQLVVTLKRMPWQIVEDVLQAGGCTEKYEVIPPTKC